MKRALRWLGTGLLFVLVALCFAPTLVPPFLDRIYYRGPISDHFDGQRFFNPDADAMISRPSGAITRWLAGRDRAPWPAQVPVHPVVPARRVTGNDMRVTWIGHSTVLVQTAGLNILTDPVWSERASPFSFIGPKRVREPGVRFDDLPKIDLVVISHDHYDHMDIATLKRLWERDRPRIVTSLGNDTILRRNGIPALAFDWGGRFIQRRDGGMVAGHPTCEGGAWQCGEAYAVTVERVHHWSSRWLADRSRALWSGFTIETPAGKIFFAGDTAWGDGAWVRQAAAHGPFRLAIIPIGAWQPEAVMHTNHVNPQEAFRIFRTLNPTRAIGVHWGTFQLSFEPIDAPRQAIAALAREQAIPADRFIAPEAGQTFSVPPAP
ncbi:MBL fold metallo-hydrolase [Sphingosinicella ginsenosidimutans]|nr:MBL fold metallo-hydrolase [Sphingosinicella ginsenosidimutans]